MSINQTKSEPIDKGRRRFNMMSTSLILTYFVGGQAFSLTPAEAQEKKLTYTSLSKDEANTISFIADAIVPGAAKAGIAHYVDYQLSTPSEDCSLILKYLGAKQPFRNFYQSAIAALKHSGAGQLSGTKLKAYIAEMSKGNPIGWADAPPAPFFYFVLRSDAIDVVYGTPQGFDRLDIPYMAHIEPTEQWS